MCFVTSARRKLLTCHRGAALRGRLDDRLVDFDIVDTVGKAGRSLAHSLGFAKDVALSPDGVDADTARAGDFQLATELADEDVDDLRLRLVHAAIEVAEESCLAEDGSLAQRQKLDNPEFLACQRKLFAVDQRQMAVKVDFEIANRHGGRAVAVRAADDGIEIGQKLETVERLGEIPSAPAPSAAILSSVLALPDTTRIGTGM